MEIVHSGEQAVMPQLLCHSMGGTFLSKAELVETQRYQIAEYRENVANGKTYQFSTTEDPVSQANICLLEEEGLQEVTLS